jgi:hypothetical protein
VLAHALMALSRQVWGSLLCHYARLPHPSEFSSKIDR